MRRWRISVGLAFLGVALGIGGCGGKALDVACDGGACSAPGAVPGDAWAGPPDGGDVPPPGTWDGGATLPTTCGVGACPSEGYSCKLDCNTCSCSRGGWACTEMACGEPPAPTTCPAAMPTSGAACSGTGSCSYVNSCGMHQYARCDGGRFIVDPAPPCPCPADFPKNRSQCPDYEGAACSYPNSCGGSDEAYCKGGSWNAVRTTCPVPEEGCPSTAPAAGSACSAVVKCQYHNTCGSMDTAVCTHTADGRLAWQYYTSSCAKCPTTAPAAGTACTASMNCRWNSSCGGRDTGMCAPDGSGGRSWTVTIGECPAACPASLPTDGTACSGRYPDCTYSNDCGGLAFAYCDGSAWHAKKTECVEGCPATMPASGATCSKPTSQACTYVPRAGCTAPCFCATDGRWACMPETCRDNGSP